MIAVLFELGSYKRFFLKQKQVCINISLAYWYIDQIYLYHLVVYKTFVDFYSKQLKLTIGTVNLLHQSPWVSKMTM